MQPRKKVASMFVFFFHKTILYLCSSGAWGGTSAHQQGVVSRAHWKWPVLSPPSQMSKLGHPQCVTSHPSWVTLSGNFLSLTVREQIAALLNLQFRVHCQIHPVDEILSVSPMICTGDLFSMFQTTGHLLSGVSL